MVPKLKMHRCPGGQARRDEAPHGPAGGPRIAGSSEMQFRQWGGRALFAVGVGGSTMACAGGTEPRAPQLSIAVQSATAKAPANVSFLVKADDSKGEPLAGLQIQDFTLREDGQAVS